MKWEGIILMGILVFSLFINIIPENIEAYDINNNQFILAKSHASFLGEGFDNRAGITSSIVGDINGDGFDDILIGAPMNREEATYSGQVYLIFGKYKGWDNEVLLSMADASFHGESSNNYAGEFISAAGDVNSDGFDDFLIGVPAYGSSAIIGAGKVYLYFGKQSGWSIDMDLEDCNVTFLGQMELDGIGRPVAGVGDVNGDGYDDIMFGYKNNKIVLFFGKKEKWHSGIRPDSADVIISHESGQYFYYPSISGMGDINNDGYDDILIGDAGFDTEKKDCGKVYLIMGRSNNWPTNYDLNSVNISFIGENSYDGAGSSISLSGDINNDGYNDILIGAPGYHNGSDQFFGKTYIFLGSSSKLKKNMTLLLSESSVIANETNYISGVSLSYCGDLNNDNYDDFIIGSLFDGDLAIGKSFLYLGKDFDLNDNNYSFPYSTFIGEHSNDYAGSILSSGGDINGDGTNDIVIGAWGYMDPEISLYNMGKVYLIFPNSIPPPPFDVKASLIEYGKKIQIEWNGTFYWNEPITGFRVYRSCDGVHYKMIGFEKQSFIDQDVENGITYYYSIVTVDGEEVLSSMESNVAILCEVDSDNDHIGNTYDLDDDNDGILDVNDDFPLNSTEWLDSDRDGIGNNADDDDDNDGIHDQFDPNPLSSIDEIISMIEDMNLTFSNHYFELLSHFIEFETDLNSLKASIIDLEMNISDIINNISGYINISNFDLSENIERLEISLLSDILSLNYLIFTTNLSIQKELILINNNMDEINESLMNISSLMMTIEELNILETKIDEITTNLLQLQSMNEQLSDVEKEQSNTSDKIDNITFLIILIILILIINDVFLIAFLLLIQKKKNDMDIKEY